MRYLGDILIMAGVGIVFGVFIYGVLSMDDKPELYDLSRQIYLHQHAACGHKTTVPEYESCVRQAEKIIEWERVRGKLDRQGITVNKVEEKERRGK